MEVLSHHRLLDHQSLFFQLKFHGIIEVLWITIVPYFHLKWHLDHQRLGDHRILLNDQRQYFHLKIHLDKTPWEHPENLMEKSWKHQEKTSWKHLRMPIEHLNTFWNDENVFRTSEKNKNIYIEDLRTTKTFMQDLRTSDIDPRITENPS